MSADVDDAVPTDAWLNRPWQLLPNRVSRFYRGGRLLDEFRGQGQPADTDRPEDWIGSATATWRPAGDEPTSEGLGAAAIDGAGRRVADLLAADPIAVAGPAFASAGRSTGILVKLLDAAIRLPVHAHPTRSFARAHLGSAFGKAESWIVLATRTIPGEEPPNVRLGFDRDVEAGELRRWIDDEDSASLLRAMTARQTAAGDLWFVPPGAPHAIGAGVFLLEVQEPSDFSIVLETGSFPIAPADAHLGLGWDVMIDAVDRRAMDDDAVSRLSGQLEDRPTGTASVLPAAADPFFRVARLVVDEGRRSSIEVHDRFVVAAVTRGRGLVRAQGGELEIRGGSTFGLPAAALDGAEIVASGGPLEILVCSAGQPPQPR